MRIHLAVVYASLTTTLIAQSVSAPPKDPLTPSTASASVENSPAAGTAYVPVLKFSPNRNASADIQAAIVEAKRTGKRIILDVGGDWCQYCHQMDQFFGENPKILAFRDLNFITVAIYYGSDNKNQQTLSHYSKVLGIPHFFVLEKDGTLLHSQHVSELRVGGKYDLLKMKEFFEKWSPRTEGVANNDSSAAISAPVPDR